MYRYVLRHNGTDLRLRQGSVLVIGRDPSCDIRVDDRAASRRHARLSVTNAGVLLEDLKSRNGVFINGSRVEGSRPLSAGTTFQVGRTRFSLRNYDEQPVEDTSVDEFETAAITDSKAVGPTGPYAITVDEALDPIRARLEAGRRALQDRARGLPERFTAALGHVQELIDAGADANARLLFGESLDVLLQARASSILPSVTVARAHAYLGRWAARVQSSAAWDARRAALQRAEKFDR